MQIQDQNKELQDELRKEKSKNQRFKDDALELADTDSKLRSQGVELKGKESLIKTLQE